MPEEICSEPKGKERKKRKREREREREGGAILEVKRKNIK